MAVVVVGSCMTDLISYVPRLPKPGETLTGHRFSKGFGGKGANQCVMAARLGVSTTMVAKVGDDTFGHDTIKNFKNNGVNTDLVQMTPDSPSGVAPITVNDAGENAIVIVSGANSKLSPDDVISASDIIAGASVLVCQLEIPKETTLEALKLAKKNGVLTLFNAAPGMAGLSDEFFQNSDILCVNETEAELISSILVTDLDSGRAAVKALHDRKCGCVVLTMGGSGVLFTERNSSNDVYHIEAMSVNVLDTTGAGDAFVGALAFYLSKYPHLGFKDMVYKSSVIASYSVTLPGTQTSYVTENLPKNLFE